MGQDPGFTLRVEVPVVTVDVSVTISDGRPVDGLLAGDFRVFDGGVEQELRYFGPASEPYHVYVLLDVSESTAGHRDFMRQVVFGFLDSLRPRDQASIGVFSREPETLVAWTDSREAAERQVRAWASRGDMDGTTEFYRSLEWVLDRGFDGIDERRAVVVLTDGRDAALYRQLQQDGRLPLPEEESAFRDLLEAATTARIPVYFVAMNTDMNLEANAEGNEYRSLRRMYPDSDLADRYLGQVRIRMERIAAGTGGQVYLPGDVSDVVPLFGEIAAALGQSYSLGWTPPVREDGTPRTIEVRISNPEYRVRQSRYDYPPR